MTPEEATRLAELLRTKRHALGLSVRELAHRSGINPTTVLRLEAAQIPTPKAESLIAIGKTLGVATADLFAVASWLPKGQLPTLSPYLRATYGELPEESVNEIEEFVDRLRARHGQHGPIDSEDEQP
jgi:transcriptional regulator with XRE-family HTH domain